MKKRQIDILQVILENEPIRAEEIMKLFHISKRTFYYDIENINFHIKSLGQLRKSEYGYRFVGDRQALMEESLDLVGLVSKNQKERQQTTLYKMLLEPNLTIDDLINIMSVSKNTMVSDIDDIRSTLEEENMQLVYQNGYQILGDEWKIRDYFLNLMDQDSDIFKIRDERILKLDKAYDLKLTDYSMSNLSQFIRFIIVRLQQGYLVDKFEYQESDEMFGYLQDLIGTNNDVELGYLSAYIKSLQSLKSKTIDELMIPYVNRLVSEFETMSATTIHDKEHFKANLRQHLQSSYYRIKYKFPATNPQLNLIKSKYHDLFYIISRIIEAEPTGLFRGMREEEVAYLAIYFGGYLRSQNTKPKFKNKVVLICPHGLMVSKQLEIQIVKAIPDIEVVARLTLSQLDTFTQSYDYIISTIPLQDYTNVLLVNALLSDQDMNRIQEAIHRPKDYTKKSKVDQLIEAVSKYGTISDEHRLRAIFSDILYTEVIRREKEPMLKELLVKEVMQHVSKVNTWQEAITLASQPLIKSGSIEPEYIQSMIDSIEVNGPYIVLADYFALPHASSGQGVNKLSMALLSLDEPVDLKGKPVKLFIVLAPIDNTTHMVALASLTEILMEDTLLDIFINGELEEILELINKKGGEV